MEYTYPIYASIRNTDGTLFLLRYTDLTLASVVLDEDTDTRYTLGDRIDDWFRHTDPKNDTS